MERLFHASASILYRCDAASITGVSGSLADTLNEIGGYDDAIDPLHPEESRLNLPISVLSRLKVWKTYLQSQPFHELMHPRDADYLLHIRLTETEYHAPGMVGLVLARSFRQPDFDKADEKILRRILAPLCAVAKRSRRFDERMGMAMAILDEGHLHQIALDMDGRLLWASRGAQDCLGLRRCGPDQIPAVLVSAARQLGELARGNLAKKKFASDVSIPRPNGSAIQAELRLARTNSGEYFVLALLNASALLPETLERRRPFGLTLSECKVLALLAQGLPDAEIGRRLFVSHATIRTHVGRILGKLGVDSRVQAALLTYGFLAKSDS